jgi:hypothetical protein
MQSNLLDGTFGLKEIIKNKDQYLESAYSLEFGYRVAYIETEIFVKYAKEYVSLSNFMGKSTIQTRAVVRNP